MIRSVHIHLSRYLPIYVFTGLYFATTIAGNIAYLTPFGREWPEISITGFSWQDFGVAFDLEYWALLVMPLIVVPPVAILASRVSRPAVEFSAPWVSEINPIPYALISAALFAYVFVKLSAAEAFAAMTGAGDAISAATVRIKILSSLGFWPQMVMQSVLAFLAIYAVVRSARGDGWFWLIAATISVPLLSVALILLNMKWPVVVFILLVGIAVLVSGKNLSLIRPILILLTAIFAYLVISVVLLRAVPSDATDAGLAPASLASSKAESETEAVDRPIALSPSYFIESSRRAVQFAPALIVVALNRMAMAAPYYYDRFTRQGQICGTILDRIKRKPSPCQPSNYIYSEMFPDDGFDAGTAPAAVNLYGYALGGWPGAIVETFLAGIIIGLFLPLWRLRRPIVTTAFVMGSYAAYFMTQLPIEAAIIYSHGALWWGALIFAMSVAAAMYRAIKS